MVAKRHWKLACHEVSGMATPICVLKGRWNLFVFSTAPSGRVSESTVHPARCAGLISNVASRPAAVLLTTKAENPKQKVAKKIPLHGGRVLERCVHGRSNGRQRAPKGATKLFGHELSPIRIRQNTARLIQMLGCTARGNL